MSDGGSHQPSRPGEQGVFCQSWGGPSRQKRLLRPDPRRLHHLRPLRLAHYGISGSNTPLRFHALEANYDVYWRPDSDASTGLDTYEAYLWHRAQGDECLNCEGPWGQMTAKGEVLVMSVRK